MIVKSVYSPSIWYMSEWTYSAVSIPETTQSLAGMLPLVLRNVSLENSDHDVPELVVLLFEQDDQACGLRVE
jgi:hypothetical protein